MHRSRTADFVLLQVYRLQLRPAAQSEVLDALWTDVVVGDVQLHKSRPIRFTQGGGSKLRELVMACISPAATQIDGFEVAPRTPDQPLHTFIADIVHVCVAPTAY